MNKQYQSFFKKRLQTQSFLDTQMSTNYMSELTEKIISSLKRANQDVSKKKQKVELVNSRLKTKQNQEAEGRDKLRSNIQSRMRISQTNLEKIKSDRKKILSSRSEMEETRRKKFKESEKKQLQKSLLQVKKKQKQSQKFFRETKQKKQQEYNRQQGISSQYQTRYGSYHDNQLKQSSHEKDWGYSSKANSSILNKTMKPIINVLKVDDSQILKIQEKKKSIQVQKESRFLSEYMAKMENIINVRNKGNKQGKEPKPTLPKVVNREKGSVSRKKISQQIKNNSTINMDGKKKVSFSEMYMQKLTQKKQRKQAYHSTILQQGDQILQREQEKTKVLKQSKIIKESLNQFRRWSNLANNIKHS